MLESVQESAIRVRDLVVGFGRQTVLDDLSLDVRRGEILGLVGASGGGKSVLMRTIIGLVPRRAGTIEVMGQPIGSAHDRSAHGAAGTWGMASHWRRSGVSASCPMCFIVSPGYARLNTWVHFASRSSNSRFDEGSAPIVNQESPSARKCHA